MQRLQSVHRMCVEVVAQVPFVRAVRRTSCLVTHGVLLQPWVAWLVEISRRQAGKLTRMFSARQRRLRKANEGVSVRDLQLEHQ
jgi:hypothetical protein